MSEKKNIDRLFQEKFRDFEAEPAEHNWEAIAERLGRKKRRRAIPIWWWPAGVAAVLLIGFLLLNPSGDRPDPNAPETRVTQSGQDRPEGARSPIVPGNIQDSMDRKPNDVNPGTIVHSDIENPSGAHPDSGGTDNASLNADGTSQQSDDSGSGQKRKKMHRATQPGAYPGISPKRTGRNTSSGNSEQALATSGSGSKKPNGHGSAASATTEEKNRSAIANVNAAKGQKSGSDRTKSATSFERTEDNKVTEPTTLAQNTAPGEPGGKETKNDSAAVATVESIDGGELFYEKEQKSVTDNERKINRWQIETHLAPIYLSSLGNGSPIDPQFAGNDKNYQTTLSYGVGARYALGKRLAVRTGVNSLAMEYRTNDIIFNQTTAQARRLEHMEGNAAARSLNIQSTHVSLSVDGMNINANQGKNFSGSLSQRTGYLEVPVELSYVVLDKRFGVEVIGGMSTLFLQENEISLISGGTQMQIGRADNLNSAHFSTNLGLGLHYKLFTNMRFRVEPMLKYQLNQYSDAGNFKPYIFGIYTGLNYRF